MKSCAELQLELGGRQVLVCWRSGVYELGVSKAESWLRSVAALREFCEWCLDKGVLVEMELAHRVYLIVDSLDRMVAAIEKVVGRMLHAHISETGKTDIGMGEPSRVVDDPDRWIGESLAYVKKVLPGLRF